jgi:hypothetical protein
VLLLSNPELHVLSVKHVTCNLNSQIMEDTTLELFIMNRVWKHNNIRSLMVVIAVVATLQTQAKPGSEC